MLSLEPVRRSEVAAALTIEGQYVIGTAQLPPRAHRAERLVPERCRLGRVSLAGGADVRVRLRDVGVSAEGAVVHLTNADGDVEVLRPQRDVARLIVRDLDREASQRFGAHAVPVDQPL